MKIICVGKNYRPLGEKGQDIEQEYLPPIFLKNDSSILAKNIPFFIPDFSSEVNCEIELIFRINKVGKYISEKFAHKYYDAVSVGLDFTAVDLYEKLTKNGLSWEPAKAFDGSAVIGKWIEKKDFLNAEELKFHLDINGQTKQIGCSADMIVNINKIISYVSKFFTLKIGDIIFTGSPTQAIKIKPDDKLRGFLDNQELLSVLVK